MHPLTDKLCGKYPSGTAPWLDDFDDFDKCITDFMKQHDEEIKIKTLNEHWLEIKPDFWGIEKRREQASWLLKNFNQPRNIDSIVFEAFGLEPENPQPLKGSPLDPEPQSQEVTEVERAHLLIGKAVDELAKNHTEIADLKKRVEALESDIKTCYKFINILKGAK